MSDLLPIGQFAALSGLSPKALRIYHEQGLLVPASVDRNSGYRSYSADQLHDASLIALLRRAGVALGEIAAYLADRDPDRVSRWRSALDDDHARRRRLLDELLTETQEPTDERRATTMTTDPAGELQRAIPILASLDLEATQRFYVDRLGFTAGSVHPDYAIVERDGIEIHFWLTDDVDIPKQTACYVRVTGIDALHEEFAAQKVVHPNGPLADRPWGQREFAVLDGDGNLIRFGEPVAT